MQPRPGETLASFRSRAGRQGIRGSEVQNLWKSNKTGYSVQNATPSTNLQGSRPNLQVTAPSSRFQNASGNLQVTADPRQTAQPKKSSSAGGGELDFDSMLADLNSEMQRLIAEINSTPAAPFFDFTANYNQARKNAKKAVSPIYQKKMESFIRDQQLALERAKFDSKEAIKRANEDLGLSLESNEIERGRTIEDTEMFKEESQRQEGNFQDQEGKVFDTQMREKRFDVVAQGLATSGLGKQAVREMIEDRNIESEEQLYQFETERKVQDILKDRTLADLDRDDEIEKLMTERGIDDIELNLDRLIEDQKIARKDKRRELATDESMDILDETGRQIELGKRKFYQDLLSQGRTTEAQAFARDYL